MPDVSVNPDTVSESSFADLFVGDVPMMDVRAPIEFARGAFPNSTNVPLLDDQQRETIGIVYKKAGQQAAIAEGERLATESVRQQRLDAWREFAANNPAAVLYCFRGGLRSQITQRWLHESGVHMPLVSGGYKALRRFLIDQLERLPSRCPMVLISGRTGTGKTELLAQLATALDLEAIARHRGSSFGTEFAPQPTPIDFENAIAVQLLKYDRAGVAQPLMIEDEGKLIGRLRLPSPLEQAMSGAPVLQLESSLEDRVERIVNQYVVSVWEKLRSLDAAAAEQRFAGFVLGNLDRIRRRLGGQRHREIRSAWELALTRFVETGDTHGFRPGIAQLLQSYYDPMYDYQLQQRDVKVLARGNHRELLGYIEGMDSRACLNC